MSVKEIFAQQIKQLRENRGWGLRRAADEMRKAGYTIGYSSLSQYENCKRVPDIDVCKMFADFYGVTCDSLLYFDK